MARDVGVHQRHVGARVSPEHVHTDPQLVRAARRAGVKLDQSGDGLAHARMLSQVASSFHAMPSSAAAARVLGRLR
jgi:hypothetical protein